MDINRIDWWPALILIVVPVALVGVLKLLPRKRRNAVGSGWGGTLLIAMCWLVAMWVILDHVR
ncbi:MAG TPA: hypothetical protein VFF96_04705 [Pseudoxanthomonas sp.]|jgi:hypothetical protein|nr:hypothetical protein [Pseudoxanthomonas sp.]